MTDRPPNSGLLGAPQVERYEIRERLGEGAMGVVFRAFDREVEREVALKTLRHPDADDLRHLKREFRSLADVTHPNLAQLYDLDTLESPPFFTLELIEGRHFDVFVRSLSGDSELLREALWQLALGLHALHGAGQHHRDIKPSNVMVEPGGRAVLLDFGLATSPNGRMATTPGRFAGTTAYMAPEQLWGLEATARSDWFSVAAMLYEAMAGCLPYGPAGGGAGGSPPASLRALAPGVPLDLDELVMSLLRVDPLERPAEAEILERLRRGVVAPGPRPSPRVMPPPAGALVGRREPLERLSTAFEATGTTGGAVRVVGISGIGKSALIEDFVGGIDARGEAVVLRSRCHPQESVRFRAVDGLVDELTQWLASEPAETLLDVAPPHPASLARVFPVLTSLGFASPRGEGNPEELDPLEVRRLAFASLRHVLSRVAARQRLVVWIDDLQWGDVDSAAVLRELLHIPQGKGLFFLLSYRSEEAKRSPLLRALEADGSTFQSAPLLELGPLDAEETRDLVRRVLPSNARNRPGFIEAIAAEAGGSPFFVGELVRTWDPGGAAPALRVETVVQERVDGLPDPLRRILETVAVAGGAIDRSLALEAAGVGEAGRPMIATLHQDCLLRITGGDESSVEPYHDRIRESVLDRLGADVLRDRHRSLATTLEASLDPDPEALATHFEGAGLLERAGEYAALAADRAAETLAFERAAELYANAIRWGPGDAERTRAFRVKRAEALVNAGHAAAAAPIFQEASMGAPRMKSLELRRRAVEQLLVSGRIDEGEAALRPLLQELGLAFPGGPRSAMLRTIARLAQVAFLRARWASRGGGRLTEEDRTRIDLCYAAARGLSAVDTVRGAYLPCMGLRLALSTGDPKRVGRSLAAVGGAVLAPLPKFLSGWGLGMLEEARAIGRETEDPYLLGVVEIAAGQHAVVHGDWQGAIDRSSAGVAILEGNCRGISWERNVAHTALTRGLEEQGRMRDLVERAGPLRERARAAGDLYGEMVAALIAGPGEIAAGAPEQARRSLDDVLARWSQGGFHLQHLYALRIAVMADLYEGDSQRAWARLEAAWSALEGSVLLRVPITRIDALLLRARCALAIGSDGAVALMRSDANRLAREGRPDVSAHAELLKAGIAASQGQEARARAALAAAIDGYDRCGMRSQEACAQHRMAGLLGPEEGAALRARADATLTGVGVADPDRWVALQAPGFSP